MSSTTVGRLVDRLGYGPQSLRKEQEGTVYPGRNPQFEYINGTAGEFVAAGQAAITVHTRKKELVGNCANADREWHPKGTPPAVMVHDSPTDGDGEATGPR